MIEVHPSGFSVRMWSLAARWCVLTVTATGALLGLFVPTSLVSRVHEASGSAADTVNVLALCLASVGWADVIWHDIIGGRLIWPSLDQRLRHAVCVGLYSTMGAIWLLKAFVAASAIVGVGSTAGALVAFALFMASCAAFTAVAVAMEDRK